MKVTYLFTTFPVLTETFLQREITAMQKAGVDLTLKSLWGGGNSFQGLPIRRFRKHRLIFLLWRLPLEWWRRPEVFPLLLSSCFRRKVPSLLNFLENLLGMGYAISEVQQWRKAPPDHIHAVWGSLPATAAWTLSLLTSTPFSMGAHAYDIFENGGDWLLREKISRAQFVHTSTREGEKRLLELGCSQEKILLVRRGLAEIPQIKPLRSPRLQVRLLCVARLVEKKGLFRQLEIYSRLREEGIPFEARIVGEGPLRKRLLEKRDALGLAGLVHFAGRKSEVEVQGLFAWADVLFHTGIIAKNGDRDGLPNVIPEAMARGVVVCSSPVSGSAEVIVDGENGFLMDPAHPEAWASRLWEVVMNDQLAEVLRRNGRDWVREHFDAHKNAAILRRAMAGGKKRIIL
ncbi:MAG: glycosyltransferase [Opitutales bacterium]